jgi:integrase
MELALLSPIQSSAIAAEDRALSALQLRLLEGVERGLSSSDSRRAYRTSLLQFFCWCHAGATTPVFSRLAVLQYKDFLIGLRSGPEESAGGAERRYSPATVNLRLAAVRALAQEAADAGVLSQSEAAAIRRVRGEKISGSRIGNWLRKDQVDEALMSIDRSTLRGKRDYAMLAVLFATALRRRELVELEVSDIQERDGQWGFIGLKGKGAKIRDISLPVWVREAVLDWLRTSRVVRGALFRSISRHGKLGTQHMSEESVKVILSHYMTPLGHDSFRPHDARRTCARLCRAGNATLEDVRELLGHASIQTTERYLGRTESFKRAITNLITEPHHTV